LIYECQVMAKLRPTPCSSMTPGGLTRRSCYSGRLRCSRSNRAG